MRDRDGNDWVVLDSYMKQVDPLADKGWRGLQETSGIDTLLITAGEAKAFLAAMPAEPRFEIHDLIDSTATPTAATSARSAGPGRPATTDTTSPSR